MARKGIEPRPEPLPPETRPVGQLVAETLRFYGRRFWPCLALGLPIALLDVTLPELSRSEQVVFTFTAGATLVTLAFIGASALVSGTRLTPRRVAVAFVAGVLIFLPFPILVGFVVLPGVAWLALLGLAIPAAVVEGVGLRPALSRGYRLARADYVHALGSLAALVVVYTLTRLMLFVLLHGVSENGERTAAFLADLVISPILFLGAGLLYFDQAARLESRSRRRRSRDADLHHALEPDRPGRADAEGKPRPAAGGQS